MRYTGYLIFQKTDQGQNFDPGHLPWIVEDGIHTIDCQCFNSLPKDKILHRSRLKAFADDKKNVTEKLKFVLERTENILDY